MDTSFFKKYTSGPPSTVNPWNTYPDLESARHGNKHTTGKWLETLPFPSTKQEYREYAQLARRYHVELAEAFE